MSRHCIALAVLLTLLATAFYSAEALCCNADGIGTSKQRTVAAATVQSAPASAAQAPVAKPDVAATQSSVTAGAAMSNDDAGNNLGESVSSGTHRRGLRWQSFLPGVIK